MARGSGDVSLPVGSRGRVPVGVLDEVSQKLKQNVKLLYNFERFPVENSGFNEHRSRAWTVYIANIIQKKFWRFNGGVWTPPLGTLVGLAKATARVDSRLKVMFGKLVSKSTHHVWQVDYLVVDVGLWLGLWWRADCSVNFSQKLASLGNYILLNEE